MAAQAIETRENGNQETNSYYKTTLHYLVMSLYHCSESGWLMLASFFYKVKHTSKIPPILSHDLSNYSTENIFLTEIFSEIAILGPTQ